MASTAHQNDSSMDDILTSIRNIISDDVKQSVGGTGGEKNAYPRTEKTLSLNKTHPESRAEPQVETHTETHTETPSPHSESAARCAKPETHAAPLSSDEDISLTLTHAIPPAPHSEKSIAQRIRSRIRAESSDVSGSSVSPSDTYSQSSPLPDALSEALGKELMGNAMGESESASTVDPETADYLDVDAIRASLTQAGERNRTPHVSSGNVRRGGGASSTDGQGALNVEQLVREALHPLLHDWLANNLTGIVRDVVSENIEKMLASRHK